MVSQVATLWAAVLLLASMHNCDEPAVSERSPTLAKNSCLSEAGAILEAPPIPCQPLVACNGEQIEKAYVKVHETCRIKATQRLNEREYFHARIDYWQGDHVFLFDNIVKSHASHTLMFDAERITQVPTKLIEELNLKLLIYSIEAGRIQDALLLYVTLKDDWKAERILDEIQTNPSGVNEVIVLHVLEFARALPVKNVRVELYKALVVFLRRNNLNSSYVSLLYAADSLAVFTTEKDKKDYFTPPYEAVLKVLRSQLQKQELDFNVWIANKYPPYYTHFITEIFTIDSKTWQTIDKRRLFEIAGMFKAKGHRFQVIEQFLKYAKDYDSRNVSNLVKMMPTLAVEVDNLRRTVEQTGNHKNEVDKIKTLQGLFKTTFWNRRQYRTYLHIMKTEGKFGKKYIELQSKG
ncbi:uncharacterized protein LOC126558205 [Anopheles maculipalpis]|uniref:uncharacterized protein LOC126558205 n=1 Tax=Anopheles maculipalpis TaxID=1496333 RepID=UPI0021596D15|nr:uncharacterized protein LOC126558205 [Anopheles maculipalpis]